MIKEMMERILPGSDAHKYMREMLDKMPPAGSKPITDKKDLEEMKGFMARMEEGKKMREEAVKRLKRGDFDVHD